MEHFSAPFTDSAHDDDASISRSDTSVEEETQVDGPSCALDLEPLAAVQLPLQSTYCPTQYKYKWNTLQVMSLISTPVGPPRYLLLRRGLWGSKTCWLKIKVRILTLISEF